ncbi:MAG: aminopeptidase [Bacillota bacterium]
MGIFAAAKAALTSCLGIKPGEQVVVLTDGWEPAVVDAFKQAAFEAGGETLLVSFLPRRRNGEEPPPAVAAAMAAADIVLMPTSRSLSHTKARRRANEAGARVASMPSITAEMMERALAVDYRAMGRLTHQWTEALTRATEARLISPAGTELVIGLGERKALADTGQLMHKGSFGNLPAGEAFIAPVEGTAQGTLVLDGSLAGWGKLASPVVLRIAQGLVASIEGGQEADWLRQALAPCGEPGLNLAELGIGTNPRAKLTGVVLEDEKALGTVHLALGDNRGIGGQVEAGIHLDGMVLNPTLLLDGRLVIDAGKHLLSG